MKRAQDTPLGAGFGNDHVPSDKASGRPGHRHLLALEAVAREFRVQLAALMDAGASAAGAAPQGHPYGRHDLHQLYSAQAKVLCRCVRRCSLIASV